MLTWLRKAINCFSFSLVLLCLPHHGIAGSTMTTEADHTSPDGNLSASGKILSSKDPLSAVEVTLEGAEKRTLVTGGDGVYSFTGLISGRYLVTPHKELYSFLPRERVVSVTDADAVGLDFLALRNFFIAGRVASRDGRPIAGAKIILFGTAQLEAFTDANGRYFFEALRNGAYTLRASKTDTAVEPVSRIVVINSDDRPNINFISKKP